MRLCRLLVPQMQRQVEELESQAAQIAEVSEEAATEYQQLRQVSAGCWRDPHICSRTTEEQDMLKSALFLHAQI